MAITWQEILKYGSGGTISIFILLALIVNLSGISNVSHSGDITCLENCESYINFTSTYWEFCFEKGGDKNIIYKKQTRSRRLWINMDKIDYLVPTEPKVEITLQVPTYGRKWRNIKENDCLRRTTKANPLPIRLKIIGTKKPEQTIKWGFDLDHWTSERVYIDPIWLGINITKLCEWKTDQQNIYQDFNHSYTCQTPYYNVSNGVGYCYEKVWEFVNSTYVYNIIFQNNYDYIIPPNTIIWTIPEITGTEDVEICYKKIGYKVNNKIINCTKYGYGCDNQGTEVCIWYCLDGDCNTELDFDYVKSRIRDDMIGGWSGKCFDVKNVDWHKVRMKLDSPFFKNLVIENE